MEVADTHASGIGTGINTSTAGVWQSETAKTSSRGKLIIIQMANCITGFSISNWLTLGFSFVPGSASWRFPLAFQICEFHSNSPYTTKSPLLICIPSLLCSRLSYVSLSSRFSPSAYAQGET
jgi:hypothetical protein